MRTGGMRAICFMLLAAMLAACGADGLMPNRLQFSAEAAPYPGSYLEDVARVVTERQGDFGLVSASVPRPAVGVHAGAPQRWYTCIRGLPATAEPRTIPQVDQLIASMIDPQALANAFHIVLFYGTRAGRPSVTSGFNSPLCKNGQYGPVIEPAKDWVTF